LNVAQGSLTLGTTTGLSVSGNRSNLVNLTGSIADLNAALASMVYRGFLDYSGADTLSITVTDGSVASSSSVAITVKSIAEQANDLQAQVNALYYAGALTSGQASSLDVKLALQGNSGDGGRVQAFLNQVSALFQAGVLTQNEANALLQYGNILLLS